MGAPAMTERVLNHVELVYAPGERELAVEVLRLFGCAVVDGGGKYLNATIAPSSVQANNVFYASEATPAQLRLEGLLEQYPDVSAAVKSYQQGVRSEPQTSFHFGMRYENESEFLAQIDAVEQAARDGGALAGRVAVSGVYHPGDPDAATNRMVQAFLWTDVIAAGLLCVGQHFEVQLWTGEGEAQ
jgi:hypothetical protein